MKKFLFLLWISSVPVLFYAQDELYTSVQKTPHADTANQKSNIEYVQYCLGQYYKERQAAWYMAATGIAIGAASVFIEVDSDINPFLIASGVISLSSFGIFWHADRWLRKSSVYVGPTGIKITF